MQIEAISGILSSDLYSSAQFVDTSQTICSSSIPEDGNYKQQKGEGSTVLNLQNIESFSPSEDIFPLRSKKLNDIYMNSVKVKKVNTIHDLNKNIAENYPDSIILTRDKDGDVLTKANISEIKNMLGLIKQKSLPTLDEKELESFPKDGSLLIEEPFLNSDAIMDKFSDVFTILSSIPREMRADIIAHTHNIIQKAGEDLSNLPDMFLGNGIHYLLQPFTDVSLNPSEIIKIYSSLFEGVEENFLIFLEIVERVFLLALSSSNIVPPTASRKLKVLESTQNQVQRSRTPFKQQSLNFWYNTICQTIQNIELLNVVYSFLIPQGKQEKSAEFIDTPKTPTLGGFREIVEKGLNGKMEIIKTGSVRTQEVIFDGWKKAIYGIGHSINSKFSDTRSLCVKYKLITSQKENIDNINESYQVRKFKGLIKELKDDEELFENDKLTYLTSLGLENSSVKLSTDERQSIITVSTNFLLSVAEDLSEVDLLSKCFGFISKSKSLENKSDVLKMDTVSLIICLKIDSLCALNF
ncbi:hypothetical protein FG386_002091 [Cryptosporidium ryanae]|uniref:uncharacterized protein n=1 Tax=Cryptosporidium ryanae TaxID=515981 RepID=UPI003519FCDE|nr:hypothetical protein FG386_002091 [Cryptosporidium ryanae]